MRLLQRRRMPRSKTIRPAESYLAAGAAEARRLGHNYISSRFWLVSINARGFDPPIVRSSLRLLNCSRTGADTDSW
jgi:hypothetical protein